MATGTDETRDTMPERSEATETPPSSTEQRRTPFTQQVGRGLVLVAAALFAVFALTNLQPVEFDWVFGATTPTVGPAGEASGGVPLIVLLLAAFALGAIVGAFGLSRRRRR